VTEAAVRTFGGSDFGPSELYTAARPVTVYLRWPERNLEALVPLVRLVWDSLLGELIEWWAAAAPAEREKAWPVLCLVDEAARAPIPALPAFMSTAAGYGISIWVAVQSLAQLETNYGPGRAATIRDNADAHVYYRQRDLETAEALSRRTGSMLVHGHNNSHSQGSASTPTASWSEGYSEREQPLLLPHEVLQLDAEHVIAFCWWCAACSPRAHRLAERCAAARPDWPDAAGCARNPRDAVGRLATAGGETRNLDKYGEREEPGRLMTQQRRVGSAALLLVVVIIGGLWLVDRREADTQPRRQAEQQQTYAAQMTATVVNSNIVQAVRAATQQADAATAVAGDQATATQAVATLQTYRANLDATVTAGQTSARATNTAIAQR